MSDDLVERLRAIDKDIILRRFDPEMSFDGMTAHEAASRIEKLEMLLHGEKCLRQDLKDTAEAHSKQQLDRIEKLEAALRWICGSRTIEYFDGTVQADETKMLWTYRRIAREALEGIYDERIFKDPT